MALNVIWQFMDMVVIYTDNYWMEVEVFRTFEKEMRAQKHFGDEFKWAKFIGMFLRSITSCS